MRTVLSRFVVAFGAATVGAAVLVSPAIAQDARAGSTSFAAVDPAHLSLTATEVPDASSVVLAKHGVLRLAAPGAGFASRSTLDVSVRLKVLTEAGLARGQVALDHGGGVDLEHFEGRTIQPDGTVVPLPPDAIFRQDVNSDHGGTSVAFPALGLGAIIDYRFRIAWDAPIFPQTWYFDDSVPTLESTLTYVESPTIRLRHHLRETGRARYQVRVEGAGVEGVRVEGGAAGDRRVTIRLENLPPVVEEPRGFPFEDLAHAAWIVTESIETSEGRRMLDADWRSVVDRYRISYDAARRFGRQAQRRGRALIKDARRDAIDEHIATLFAYVRDEIEIVTDGVGVRPERTVDDVLKEGRGTSAEVALLLQMMLEAVDVPADLVWVADWRDGVPQLEVPRPGWFSKVLVRVRGATRRGEPDSLDLDPSDRRLAPGRLSPVHEGTDALLLDDAPPRIVRLATTPADQSARAATLDMVLDASGRLSAEGRLVLTGHHAWFFLRRRDSVSATVEGWRQWLDDQFLGFEVATPEVVESVDQQRIEVSWRMQQHSADVLGDESTIESSLPLGPIQQRYAQSPAQRKTPVRVSFADLDTITLDLRWPAGWQLELQPEALQVENVAGAAIARVEVDSAARHLHYQRSVRIDETVYFPGEPYAALRALYDAVARHDAKPTVLYREE